MGPAALQSFDALQRREHHIAPSTQRTLVVARWGCSREALPGPKRLRAHRNIPSLGFRQPNVIYVRTSKGRVLIDVMGGYCASLLLMITLGQQQLRMANSFCDQRG